jgi:hypothetical protein
MKLTWLALLVAAQSLPIIFTAVPPAAAGASAPVDSTTALERGRALRPHISKGESLPLWRVFNAEMRAAMGDSLRFDAMVVGIRAQVGEITAVEEETVSRENGQWVYRARCIFSKVPQPLVVNIAFAEDGRVSGLAVQPDAPRAYASSNLDYVTNTSLELPFRAEWFVFWGGRTLEENYHAASRSQRFALDLVIVKDGSSHAGEGKLLTDYYCYGQELVAPAAGTVVWSCDSLPDQAIGSADPANPVGNGVVIDHGNGEFSLLAHMQPKSLKVKVGDAVVAGALLGLCGNSGNTSEPHLHYHLQDGPDIRNAEGLPAMFANTCVDGAPVPKAEPRRGQSIKPCR